MTTAEDLAAAAFTPSGLADFVLFPLPALTLPFFVWPWVAGTEMAMQNKIAGIDISIRFKVSLLLNLCRMPTASRHAPRTRNNVGNYRSAWASTH